MKSMTKTLAKGTLGTIAAGAVALASAAPAMANDHRDRGISAGDVIAGAVIIGGIAAIASAVGGNKNNNDYRYGDDNRYRDRNYRGYGDRWQARGNPRSAVEQCIVAVERDARRAGYRFADVTQIRDVDDTRSGWRVRGNLVVDGNRGNNGWGNDRRGWNNNRSDSGKFDCRIDRGRVSHLGYSGVRGLG